MSSIMGHDTKYLHRLYEDGAGQLWMQPAGKDVVIGMMEDGDWLTDARTYGDSWDERDASDVYDHVPNEAELVAWVDIRGESSPDGRESWVWRDGLGHAGRKYVGELDG